MAVLNAVAAQTLTQIDDHVPSVKTTHVEVEVARRDGDLDFVRRHESWAAAAAGHVEPSIKQAKVRSTSFDPLLVAVEWRTLSSAGNIIREGDTPLGARKRSGCRVRRVRANAEPVFEVADRDWTVHRRRRQWWRGPRVGPSSAAAGRGGKQISEQILEAFAGDFGELSEQPRRSPTHF